MSEPKQQSQVAVVKQKRDVADLLNSEKTKLEIARVLPKHLTPERMTRVTLTATMKNPLLLECTTASLLNSLMICSQAGLEPDGRLAHLIPYWNSKKNCYECQVIFDYRGLIALALRNGAQSVYGDKVCEFDLFEAYVQDGKKVLNHRPNWSKPRGTVVCYYTVCKRGDEVDWEVMTGDEVDDIRKRSRAADKGPWVTDYDEMAKKTVIRRMSKRWDLLPEIRDAIYADDDTPAPFGQVVTSAPIFTQPAKQVSNGPADEQPEPERGNGNAPEPQPENEDGDVGPQPERRSEPVEPVKQNYLKAVRNLCKIGKIKEGDLLDYLAASGASEGDFGSLDEMAMAGSPILKLVHDQWADLSGKITELTKKGAAK